MESRKKTQKDKLKINIAYIGPFDLQITSMGNRDYSFGYSRYLHAFLIVGFCRTMELNCWIND
ncbi:hypothetical protein J2Z32_002640 [Paenibacillus turicensis]|uniref:Uncharacterized protein n=1 Tax=Paenibacillus turicensis TaxID=160487 RepID=A0ABS4FTT6_9BACL|nr:hypothetical protein [Paenibacillus turicensis]